MNTNVDATKILATEIIISLSDIVVFYHHGNGDFFFLPEKKIKKITEQNHFHFLELHPRRTSTFIATSSDRLRNAQLAVNFSYRFS